MLRPFEIILSQGRIGDRTDGAIPGAAALARALSDACGLPERTLGTPEPARIDNWDRALQGAGQTLHDLAHAVDRSLIAGSLPLLAVNTCSASLATLPAAARHVEDLIVLWIDAHGDFNTPDTTGSGYLGGMALAGASGIWDSGYGGGVNPERTLLIGARDIDSAEFDLLQTAKVQIISPAEVDEADIARRIGPSPVWVHIDWDVLEPGFVPAAYRIADGLLPDQLKAILAAIPRSQIAGIELAELELPDDPLAAERAVRTAMETVAPLFG